MPAITAGVTTAHVTTLDWELWSTTARIVLTNAGPTGQSGQSGRAEEARAIADDVLADIEAASSRFRDDSEIRVLADRLPDGVEVNDTLAGLVRRALASARFTDGDVDLTLGNALDAVGYDRDIRLLLGDDGVPVRAIASRAPGWRSVTLVANRLTVPRHLALDLGATAKAVAADLVAARVSAGLGCGVLVSLGGDIATAGPAPAGGWQVLVQDAPLEPSAQVTLAAGQALATSSTQKRRWLRGGRPQHHILNPRTGLPAEPVWRTATVAAATCHRANTLSTAAIVRGAAAEAWLREQGVPARLVSADGAVVTLVGWPDEEGKP
ncbi:FAD:protein FMN transferase [Cryobacterium sp. TMT1-21]|uniref:FAD:protein FMN transferase n=1 Tax=Cryobacterium shii TaxID=1259235 RepID=A0AAQ2C7T9_9MICO|nr:MULTISPECIES: FAD:protein FMN transferase [Cryobacterium]TFC51301.1 FAD:protein FMN transferase [Cryobacterium shii]TFC83739.1 FAD:protein FMN transferase [Cryobacterium sp. TmT2-59]TFD15352.1 FAD:protein FMN transferase [Cryobacterium sp. TMT1-21]TFD20567.1 FAD:protein FMN transferase [Cryobacterium sp. TMT4-10]TFD20752.1 FAD:protein FMN transferase [Cryobacterium sp. TMT2-23]